MTLHRGRGRRLGSFYNFVNRYCPVPHAFCGQLIELHAPYDTRGIVYPISARISGLPDLLIVLIVRHFKNGAPDLDRTLHENAGSDWVRCPRWSDVKPKLPFRSEGVHRGDEGAPVGIDGAA
jgi:hypothetical protein